MKRFRSIMFLAVLGCLFVTNPSFAGASDSRYIKIVKSGILDFDPSITLGDAFDYYKFFETVSWEYFATEQGRRVVQCIGKIKDTNYILKAQFVIRKDDDTTFNISYIGVFEDDKEIIKNLGYIESIYNNLQINPDVDRLIQLENMFRGL